MSCAYTSEVLYRNNRILEYTDELYPVLRTLENNFINHDSSIKLEWSHPRRFYYSKYYVEIATDPDFKYLKIGRMNVIPPPTNDPTLILSYDSWEGVIAAGAEALRAPDGYNFQSSIIQYEVPNLIGDKNFNLDSRIFINSTNNIIPKSYINYGINTIKQFGIFGSPGVTYYIRIRAEYQETLGTPLKTTYSNVREVRTLLQSPTQKSTVLSNYDFFINSGNFKLNSQGVFYNNTPTGYKITIDPKTTSAKFNYPIRVNYWNSNPSPFVYLNSNVKNIKIDISQQYRSITNISESYPEIYNYNLKSGFISDFTSYVPSYSGRILNGKNFLQNFDSDITSIDYFITGLPTGVYFMRYQLFFDDQTKSQIFPKSGGYPIYIHDASKPLSDGSIGPYYNWADPNVAYFNLKPLVWYGTIPNENLFVQWDHPADYDPDNDYYIIDWGTDINFNVEPPEGSVQIDYGGPYGQGMGCDLNRIYVWPKQSPGEYLITANQCASLRINGRLTSTFEYYVRVRLRSTKRKWGYNSNIQRSRVKLITPFITNSYFPGYIGNYDWSTFYNTSIGFVVSYDRNPTRQRTSPSSYSKDFYVDLSTSENFNVLHPLYNNRIIDTSNSINIHPTWNQNRDENFLLTGISKAGDYYIRIRPVPSHDNQDTFVSNTAKIYIKPV